MPAGGSLLVCEVAGPGSPVCSHPFRAALRVQGELQTVHAPPPHMLSSSQTTSPLHLLWIPSAMVSRDKDLFGSPSPQFA